MNMIQGKCMAVIFIVALSVSVLAQQPKEIVPNFKLNGKMTNRDQGFIFLSYLDQDNKEVKDTARIKNGIFFFSGLINLPTRATLTGLVKSRSAEDLNFKELFLEPGNMTITIAEGDFKRGVLLGSRTQRDMDFLNVQKAPISRKRDSLYTRLQKVNEAIKNGDQSAALITERTEIIAHSKLYKDEAKRIDFTFISSQPEAYLSPYLMMYYFGSRQLTLDSASLFYNSFVPAVQKSIFGKSIKAEIDGRKLSAVGNQAPLFSKIDINDKVVNLADFKGKYVLLDFWASWCVPCREFTPKVKEIYEKYHAKGLEIISISWDDKIPAWKKAVAEEQTRWHNVIARMSGPNDESMRTKYSIPYIPTLILIDKNGIVVGRYDNENNGAALIRKMEEIF